MRIRYILATGIIMVAITSIGKIRGGIPWDWPWVLAPLWIGALAFGVAVGIKRWIASRTQKDIKK